MAIDRFHSTPVQQARPVFARWSFLPPASQTIAVRRFYITLAGARDATHVVVIFNNPPQVAQALTAGHYSIPGLTVFNVVQETALTFVLTTSAQTPGVSYTLTASNIFDLSGNPI